MNPYIGLTLYIVLIVVLLVFSAFFSCADMTFGVAPIKRLRRKGTKSALLAADLAQNYDKTIVTILFGNNLVNILASSLGAALTRLDIPLFNANRAIAATVVELIILVIVLIFGEILPKIVGKAYSFRLSQIFARPVKIFGYVFFPFVVSTSWIAATLTRPIFAKLKKEEEAPSDDELQAMVDVIEEEGIIDEDESEMLSDAIEFKDTCAYEIMTPRIKIEGFEVHDNLAKKVEKSELIHSRIIVYDHDLDHVLGYLPLKEVQKALLRDGKAKVEDLMLPILSVPRTMEISMILKAMKQSRHHIVLVKDEYGGNDGIVTMEDILEELVGEMFDESEPIKEEIASTDKRNVFLVKGSIHIEDFFDHFHIDEEELAEGVETLSGWISDRLGRFAKEGDLLTIGKVDLVVKAATPYTVEEVLAYYHPRRKVRD